jgi:hypothetical protein
MSMTFDRLTDDGRHGRGVLLFFSANNNNEDLDETFNRPWRMYERCFCVAASTLADDGVTEIKACYSNYGSTVDFCAPSNDKEGVHDPPNAYGAHTATRLTAPLTKKGQALPGHPNLQTTLAPAAAKGAGSVIVASVAGLAPGQAILIGAPGVAGTEGRKVTAVNNATNTVGLDRALKNAHPASTPVAAGPFSHRSGFGGTSYAAPVCAGTGALMLSANPKLRWNQVRDILRNSAVKIDPGNIDANGIWRDGQGRILNHPDYTGPLVSEWYGFGRINAADAVRRARRLSLTSKWSELSVRRPGWSDAAGWDDVANYSTIRLAVARDDLYLLGRGGDGMQTWRFDTATLSWNQLSRGRPPWSDARGWDDVANHSTIRLAVARDDLYLLGRSGDGVQTWRFDTATLRWKELSAGQPPWSDAAGWDDVANHSTIQLAVARDDLYLLGRGNNGADTWRFDTATASWSKRSDDTPEWSDMEGWDDVANYSTIRMVVARDDLYLLGRSGDGVDTWRFDTRQ